MKCCKTKAEKSQWGGRGLRVDVVQLNGDDVAGQQRDECHLRVKDHHRDWSTVKL